MKIALLNDTHFGARNDSLIFDDFFHKFYDEIFFPYLKEHNIKTLIHLGDVVDRRKFINFRIAYNFRNKFMKRLWEEKIDTHFIIGNHDIYYRNTNMVNSIRELFAVDLNLYETPEVVNFGGLDIALLPWVNKENEDNTYKRLKKSKCRVVMGHLELNGFLANAYHVMEHGQHLQLYQGPPRLQVLLEIFYQEERPFMEGF